VIASKIISGHVSVANTANGSPRISRLSADVVQTHPAEDRAAMAGREQQQALP